MAKHSKLAKKAAKIVSFSKRSNFGFFPKKIGDPEKNLSFSKITDGGYFAVEWNSYCQLSQRTQTIWAVLEKELIFQEKPWFFRKWLEVAFLPYNATETVRFLKTFEFLAVIKKYKGFPKKWIFFWNSYKYEFCCRTQLKLEGFSKSSKNLSFIKNINRFSEKSWTFQKRLKVANLL